MALVSTLLTAPSESSMRALKIEKLPATVDKNTLIYNDKATNLYKDLVTDYNDLVRYFHSLAEQIDKGTGYVVGSLKLGFKRVGSFCRDQEKYCKSRKNSLLSAMKSTKDEMRLRTIERSLGIRND